MAYTEKVIDGILCYQNSEGLPWHEFSQEELTSQLSDSNEAYALLHKEVTTLSAENAALNSKVDALKSLRPHWAQGHTNDSVAAQVNIAALSQLWELLGVSNQTGAVVKLKAQLAAAEPFDCFSANDGDSWLDCPDDIEFVNGLKAGDEYQVLAGWSPVTATYRVVKAPDDVDDDYQVELVAPITAPPQHAAVDPDALKRLRGICGLLGIQDAIPETDAQLSGVLFSVLGMVRAKIEHNQKLAAKVLADAEQHAAVAWFDNDGEVIGRVSDEQLEALCRNALAKLAIRNGWEVERHAARVPDECAATGLSCSYTPHGPNKEMQCEYCGAAPTPPAQEG